MGERRGSSGILWGNLREGDHLDDPGLVGGGGGKKKKVTTRGGLGEAYTGSI
jgi:hypothetical protein